MTIKDIATAEHYRWGAGGAGWHLLAREDLSVIEERVPAGDREQRHYHRRARQFFYILQGAAVIDVDGRRHELRERQGIEVAPGTPHQFKNESDADVVFLVISAPPSHGDRVDL